MELEKRDIKLEGATESDNVEAIIESAAGFRDFLLQHIPDDAEYDFEYVDKRINIGLIEVGTIRSPEGDFEVTIIADADGYDYVRVSGDTEYVSLNATYKLSNNDYIRVAVRDDEFVMKCDNNERIIFSDTERKG